MNNTTKHVYNNMLMLARELRQRAEILEDRSNKLSKAANDYEEATPEATAEQNTRLNNMLRLMERASRASFDLLGKAETLEYAAAALSE